MTGLGMTRAHQGIIPAWSHWRPILPPGSIEKSGFVITGRADLTGSRKDGRAPYCQMDVFGLNLSKKT